MALSSLLSMVGIVKLGCLERLSTSSEFSDSRDSAIVPGASSTSRKKDVNVVRALKSRRTFEVAGERSAREAENVSELERNLKDCFSDTGATGIPQDILVRTAFIIVIPALAMSILTKSAHAFEIDPIFPAMEPGSALSIEMLRYFLLLGDLDPGTAQLATFVLGPVIAILNVLFIFRIVMSWYPGIPVKKFPFVIAYNPTELVLGPTRRLIPPVGGVDVAPVIWVALMSFANEVLLGKQGLLVLLSQQQP